jgi:hypothetical protein
MMACVLACGVRYGGCGSGRGVVVMVLLYGLLLSAGTVLVGGRLAVPTMFAMFAVLTVLIILAVVVSAVVRLTARMVAMLAVLGVASVPAVTNINMTAMVSGRCGLCGVSRSWLGAMRVLFTFIIHVCASYDPNPPWGGLYGHSVANRPSRVIGQSE